jgi:hypothetical protein
LKNLRKKKQQKKYVTRQSFRSRQNKLFKVKKRRHRHCGALRFSKCVVKNGGTVDAAAAALARHHAAILETRRGGGSAAAAQLADFSFLASRPLVLARLGQQQLQK